LETLIVSDIFKQLSKRKMGIILLGDSTNNQLFGAFQQELLRENTQKINI